MTPYYQDDLVTIYHGDCREWMPDADAVLTDPPYGVNLAGVSWDGEMPYEVCERLQVAVGGPITWFGSSPRMVEDISRLRPERVLIWSPKFRLGGAINNADRLAYRFHPIYCWHLVRDHSGPVWDVLNDPTEGGNFWHHPGTKPVALVAKLVGLSQGTLLDPFMGSGTTLVAAKSLNRRAIGIEIEEAYCEVAARRCSQEVLSLSDPIVATMVAQTLRMELG